MVNARYSAHMICRATIAGRLLSLGHSRVWPVCPAGQMSRMSLAGAAYLVSAMAPQSP